jgi:dUTP pyrophosphatase
MLILVYQMVNRSFRSFMPQLAFLEKSPKRQPRMVTPSKGKDLNRPYRHFSALGGFSITILTGAQAQSMLESAIDPQVQTQMCGVELTLQKIEEFRSQGAIAYDNSERKLPAIQELKFGETDWIDLQPGSYLVTFNEIVNIPRDMAALARPRSSLLRCGASLETALWDPGYRGRSQSLLVVHNPSGIRLKKNARLLQLVFMRLDHQAEKVYSGIYQGENVR